MGNRASVLIVCFQESHNHLQFTIQNALPNSLDNWILVKKSGCKIYWFLTNPGKHHVHQTWMLRFFLTLFVGSENLCITTAPKPIRSVATCNVGNYLRDASSVATCHVVSDPRDLSNMAIYHVRSTRNVNMPPHPTPTPRQRAILKKEAKRTYGFPAVGIYIIYHLVI